MTQQPGPSHAYDGVPYNVPLLARCDRSPGSPRQRSICLERSSTSSSARFSTTAIVSPGAFTMTSRRRSPPTMRDCPNNGEPSVLPSLLATVLVLQTSWSAHLLAALMLRYGPRVRRKNYLMST